MKLGTCSAEQEHIRTCTAPWPCLFHRRRHLRPRQGRQLGARQLCFERRGIAERAYPWQGVVSSEHLPQGRPLLPTKNRKKCLTFSSSHSTRDPFSIADSDAEVLRDDGCLRPDLLIVRLVFLRLLLLYLRFPRFRCCIGPQHRPGPSCLRLQATSTWKAARSGFHRMH